MEIYWIWLSSLPYVGPVLQKSLLAHFHSPKALFEAREKDLTEVPGINKRAVRSISSNHCLKNSERIAGQLLTNNIKLIIFTDPLYPEHARQCRESPVLLYYRGNLQYMNNGIAVVGSRRCTLYGKKVAEEIGKELAMRKIPLISGFAKGIDSYAQASCLKNDGYTIAFLAGGVDICYPKEQRLLYEKMLESGSCFISQYSPGTKPNPKQFLQRNSLISAWSKEVIVVEAGEKSGALWTADFAKKQGKRVYAVPHSIDITEGKGTNLLLAEGASPFLSIESLSSITALAEKEEPTSITPKKHGEILSRLTSSPISISKLALTLKISESTLMEQLFALELEGMVMIRGNRVRKT